MIRPLVTILLCGALLALPQGPSHAQPVPLDYRLLEKRSVSAGPESPGRFASVRKDT